MKAKQQELLAQLKWYEEREKRRRVQVRWLQASVRCLCQARQEARAQAMKRFTATVRHVIDCQISWQGKFSAFRGCIHSQRAGAAQGKGV